ncbi:cytochrome b/b6 domain-containing protein [Sediminicoccus sp. KRV36]|uniref:cytochrome b/b6 domain-containing protein n=1 Tax=Sediminicoccus sp. KRV36 TaxID=3133721 RepID=UPI00200FCC42|nr:cytochrome b/b6 domain-containing protein [Sediminicoccus rosea]UPY35193.1 cytochrome b/b6 domain-containing protein [Sediminicoccus rosea]
MSETRVKETRVKIWDGWVRLVHWSIVILIPVSYLTARSHNMDWHMRSGYTLLTLVIFRILWGLVGSEPARFMTFLRSPFAALAHLRHVKRAPGPDRELTHNPAGGWMVVVILSVLLTQAVTGLFTDDQIFTRGPLAGLVSGAWSDRAGFIHIRLINVIGIVIVLHIAAVIWYRVSLGHDLVQAMMIGTKPMPQGTTPPRMGHPVLALALLGASAGLVNWISRFG